MIGAIITCCAVFVAGVALIDAWAVPVRRRGAGRLVRYLAINKMVRRV